MKVFQIPGDPIKINKHVGRYGCFPKIGVPQNGWFIVENPIEMDDLGVPLFSEPPIYQGIHLTTGKLCCFVSQIPKHDNMVKDFPYPNILQSGSVVSNTTQGSTIASISGWGWEHKIRNRCMCPYSTKPRFLAN